MGTKSIYVNDSEEKDTQAWKAAEIAAKRLRVSVSRIVLDALRAYFDIPQDELEIPEGEIEDSETAKLVEAFLKKRKSQ